MIESLRLADANLYIEDELTTRPYCIVQGTMLNIL